MKARDVLVECWTEWADAYDTRPLAEVLIDALLAQTPEGEGVYIAPDGTLMRLMRWGPVPIEEATDDN